MDDRNTPPNWLTKHAIYPTFGTGARQCYAVTFWHGEYKSHVLVAMCADRADAEAIRDRRQKGARFEFFLWVVTEGRDEVAAA